MAMASQGQCLGSSSDKNCLVDFRERLLTIDSNLGVKDVEHLKFLCQDIVSVKKLENSSSASDIFDQLLAQELLSEEDPFFLAELLYIIQRKSLLKHLSYTKEQVMNLLPTRGKISPFRKLLYKLSQEIDTETLKDIIFLLRDLIPRTPMSSLNLLDYLEKQSRINEDDLTFLENLFKTVAPKLIKMIEGYKRERAAQLAMPPVDEETESLHQGEEELFSGSDTKKFHEALPETPEYRMNGKYRGHCVIVNNHKFTSLSDRPGTDNDAVCLTDVFQWLGFTVYKYDDVTKVRMDQILQEQKSHPDHANGDCFVFCVLTHGNVGTVYSSDGACQGIETQHSVSIEADAWNPESTLQDSIPVEADFLLGLATVPGYKCFRDVEKGSWYIQSLCNCLKKLVPRNQDILSILTVVNDDVSRQADARGTKKQMPQPAFTLRKKLVFPVPQGTLQC
ncbi:caspase-10 isoform X2 [Nycticebus coucang]|uniref:caspase-10 isoform X2 n=1 Tax=Nycticebus coucang TaxID=9470 RepID=UPI00234E23D2|nr:caspase-10 isoform X2 [Nycticebus coucang]